MRTQLRDEVFFLCKDTGLSRGCTQTQEFGRETRFGLQTPDPLPRGGLDTWKRPKVLLGLQEGSGSTWNDPERSETFYTARGQGKRVMDLWTRDHTLMSRFLSHQPLMMHLDPHGF